MTETYQRWHTYWSQIHDSSEVFWNVPPAQGIELDFQRFQSFFQSTNLPLIDFGCGDGTQTEFLSQHFPQVIGLEISDSAVELARHKAKKAGLPITYQVIHSQGDVEKIHADLGDVNIYVRGVLHQAQNQESSLIVEQLKTLLGKTGTLYLIELSSAADNLLKQKVQNQTIPPELAKVLACRITPGAMSLEKLKMLFPPVDFEFLESGDAFMPMNAKDDGEIIKLPGQYAIIRRRKFQ
jgi:2-polyprenyl-3-methyl-5-hydroxy-6-metoxy-1,4-benzoquinol methylase